MQELIESAHRLLDYVATFNHDQLTPAQLWAIGETLAVLEGAK